MLIIEGMNHFEYQIRKYKDDMTDEEFHEFCGANDNMMIERDKDRNILIKPLLVFPVAWCQKKLCGAVWDWEKKYGMGISFGPSTGFELKNTAIRTANANWISSERWRTVPREDYNKFIYVPPDFIAEVVTPTSNLKTLREKMLEWIENGVRLAWLVNPYEKTTHIYRENGVIDVVEGFDKTLSGEGVMPSLELELAPLLELP